MSHGFPIIKKPKKTWFLVYCLNDNMTIPTASNADDDKNKWI